MIDMSNARANIAYTGEKPWHGLGAELPAGADIETWKKAAGLDWQVKESPVLYQNGELRQWNDRKVLYRSDNGAPLSVMGKDFNVVQPEQVLDLYSNIARAGGFELETAGALSGGKRIWALAKVGDGADVVNRDRVRPYILIATSFDGTMATVAKFTAIRVVCNNTISMAIQQGGSSGIRQMERDETAAGRQQVVRVLHSTKWTNEIADRVRMDLGIVHSAYERFMVESRALAGVQMSQVEADRFVAFLLEPYHKAKAADGAPRDVRETKGYKRIIELFNGKAVGNDLAGQTKWGMLNAVTQLIDHERGRSDNSRLESAWFGTGNAIKDRAFRILSGEYEIVKQ
jgi:phage/plasmid-like protein (TIGR03299 family)